MDNLTVGFDLDMTLIDSLPGVMKTMAALSAGADWTIDRDHVASNMGRPLSEVLRTAAVPEDRIEELVQRFRTLYPTLAIAATRPLPGAAAALDAVRTLGAKTLIVTAKHQPNAMLHVKALGWSVDHIIGDVWSVAKAEALAQHGATVFVGDHTGDMEGARVAGALGIGVVSGPCSREALTAAGAYLVLDSLQEFPAWIRSHAASSGRRS